MFATMQLLMCFSLKEFAVQKSLSLLKMQSKREWIELFNMQYVLPYDGICFPKEIVSSCLSSKQIIYYLLTTMVFADC